MEIRYFSRGKNTLAIANIIGEELKIKPKTIEEDIDLECDILFLGTAVYGFDIDEKVKEFVRNLENVKKVAIFSTYGINLFSKTVYKRITKILKKKGISYYSEFFTVKGEGHGLNKGRPTVEDLEKAKEFARKIVGE
jgi:flavodoxin